VFLLNAVDGCIPADLATGSTDEIEEERRLLYVAMTRAKLSSKSSFCTHRFYMHQQPGRGDRHLYAVRTRFLSDTLLGLFETRTWPATTDREPSQSWSGDRIDLGARMRAMWR
jgi:DNA helicase-2/ATP-dependent DNA helicase PcrA